MNGRSRRGPRGSQRMTDRICRRGVAGILKLKHEVVQTVLKIFMRHVYNIIQLQNDITKHKTIHSVFNFRCV